MSDPAPPDCGPATTYGPCAPYADVDYVRDSGCQVTGLDLTPADPEADPPTEAGADVALMADALLWASRRVFMATGYRFFGCCQATIRPCRELCANVGVPNTLPSDFPWFSWAPEQYPMWTMGLVPVWSCACAPSDPCHCTAWDRIPLPMLPVRTIEEVKIEGDVLDPAAYVLRNGAWLVRIDGEVWPSCQEDAPLGDPHTWGVTFTHGLDLPPEGKPLVAAYGVELAKSCKGQECGLAQGVKVLRRDGVDFGVAVPPTYRDKGLVGFDPLDDWISLLLGGHVTEPPRLYRPGRGSMTAPILEGAS